MKKKEIIAGLHETAGMIVEQLSSYGRAFANMGEEERQTAANITEKFFSKAADTMEYEDPENGIHVLRYVNAALNAINQERLDYDLITAMYDRGYPVEDYEYLQTRSIFSDQPLKEEIDLLVTQIKAGANPLRGLPAIATLQKTGRYIPQMFSDLYSTARCQAIASALCDVPCSHNAINQILDLLKPTMATNMIKALVYGCALTDGLKRKAVYVLDEREWQYIDHRCTLTLLELFCLFHDVPWEDIITPRIPWALMKHIRETIGMPGIYARVTDSEFAKKDPDDIRTAMIPILDKYKNYTHSIDTIYDVKKVPIEKRLAQFEEDINAKPVEEDTLNWIACMTKA